MCSQASNKNSEKHSRLISWLTAISVAAAGVMLFLLGLRHYIRLSPRPEVRFDLNEGWVFTGGCARLDSALDDGSNQKGLHCDWRLISDSYFETIGDITQVGHWCNQVGANALNDPWDLDWIFLRFNFSHSIPAWWDGCPRNVVIETSLHLQLDLK